MNSKRIKMMTQGAMLASLFGVLGIINLYTGSLFDVLFSYIMVVILTYYTYLYDYRAGLIVLITTFLVLFLVGELFFTFFTSFTLLMGVFYGYCLKHEKSNKFSKYGLIFISAIKNMVIFLILGSLLGIDIIKEGVTVYQGIIRMVPFLSGIFDPIVMFLGLWILVFICESYVIRVYSGLLLVKMMKRK